MQMMWPLPSFLPCGPTSNPPNVVDRGRIAVFGFERLKAFFPHSHHTVMVFGHPLHLKNELTETYRDPS